MTSLFAVSLKRLVPPGLALLAAIVWLTPSPAGATPYVLRLVQQGNNVVASGSGAFDLAGLTFAGVYSSVPAAILPSVGYVDTGATLIDIDGYTGFAGPTSFGPGPGAPATTGAGDPALIYGSPVAYGQPLLWVPQGYVSDTALVSGATWANATFNSLGVTPGTYTWTWGTGADQSFTLTTSAMTPVPEPATLGMFGLGVLLAGGLVTLRRRESRHSW